MIARSLENGLQDLKAGELNICLWNKAHPHTIPWSLEPHSPIPHPFLQAQKKGRKEGIEGRREGAREGGSEGEWKRREGEKRKVLF